MSTLARAMDVLPNEMWLRIFGGVDEAKSLGSVALVCRKFHILGSEALLRHVIWRSYTVAISHLEYWERNPSKMHLVRSLSLTLNPKDLRNVDPEDLRIFGAMQSFFNLNHLKLSCGALPDILYHLLQHLPSLTHLTLEACSVPPPPAFFPFSFPSTIPPPDIQVTTFTVSKLRPSHVGNFLLDAVTIPLACFFPNLQTFATDTIGIQIPTAVSAQLSSLTLALNGVVGDIQPRLAILLHRMPALTHLDISIAATGHYAPHGTVSLQPAPMLPRLHTLVAPWPAAGLIVPGAPLLAHLRVASSIPKPADAVWLLERLRGAPLRSTALRLLAWDDEVLLAAARCLPACAALEVAYHTLTSPDAARGLLAGRAATPSPGFLFDLGIQHLPLLRDLHTLRLYALPRALAGPLRFVWDPVDGPAAEPREGEQREGGEPGEDEVDREAAAALCECVHAWARYNPALRCVQLGAEPGHAWVRRAGGAGWNVDPRDDAQRAVDWALMCAQED
ncbi:hypothetical protein DFH09DRAFT_1089814 [Mycena vulgaris]|nr:hypothetical protein DFH09DRAFT_1089814 [Mycena vulgaris]